MNFLSFCVLVLAGCAVAKKHHHAHKDHIDDFDDDPFSDSGPIDFFKWLLGVETTTDMKFELKGEPNQWLTLDESKATELFEAISGVPEKDMDLVVYESWNIDISLLGTTTHVKLLEEAVDNESFLLDFLGAVEKEYNALHTQELTRRMLKKHKKKHHKTKENTLIEQEHEEEQALLQQAEQELKEAENELDEKLKKEAKESGLSDLEGKRVSIPGEGEEHELFVEISLPLECECVEQALGVDLLKIVSHVTAIQESYISVDTYNDYMLYVNFEADSEKIKDLKESYETGVFAHNLNLLIEQTSLFYEESDHTTKAEDNVAESSLFVQEASSLTGSTSPTVDSIPGWIILFLILGPCALLLFSYHCYQQKQLSLFAGDDLNLTLVSDDLQTTE